MLIPAVGTALPVVTSLRDCADYSKVIEPYIPQLYALPGQILSHIADPTALRNIYASTNPAISGLAFSIALFPIFLVVSEINKNYSQVDRVWSILPTIYHIHYAIWTRLNGLPTDKVDPVLAFSLIWTGRLTFNYWRRGGYQVGSEDYRWALIKKQIGQPLFFVLNVLFISSIQSVLLFAVTTPTYLLLLTSNHRQLNPMKTTQNPAYLFFSRFMISLVAFEWFADGQQWNYHAAKNEYQKTAKVPEGWTRAQLDRGFNATGLFKYSRHPNFAAEQTIWITLYLWGCYETGSLYNWTIGGLISYVLIFAGSTPLTERISAGKYAEYSLYQKRVGMFVPWLLGKGWSEEEAEREGPKLVEEQKRKEGKKGQ
ncbi:hypothetical protein LTR62_007278 [Meristemomyces frigidus]|uniref:Steroid 5-alpha reductase C-terminal domain-containing protein n=1 Tax=Meristemomyces frigidus TaxID=1508187 RepID=A0AAN7TAT6_9PEZI|nr:hypothetical protein LTR62_007278 [Meristemomyces frigidus]